MLSPRENALDIIQLLISHGSDIDARKGGCRCTQTKTAMIKHIFLQAGHFLKS